MSDRRLDQGSGAGRPSRAEAGQELGPLAPDPCPSQRFCPRAAPAGLGLTPQGSRSIVAADQTEHRLLASRLLQGRRVGRRWSMPGLAGYLSCVALYLTTSGSGRQQEVGAISRGFFLRPTDPIEQQVLCLESPFPRLDSSVQPAESGIPRGPKKKQNTKKTCTGDCP